MTTTYKNEEAAAMAVSEKVESIKQTLQEVMEIADEFGLTVEVFHDWDNYLRYHGRVYDYESDYKTDGGWYHSTC